MVNFSGVMITTYKKQIFSQVSNSKTLRVGSKALVLRKSKYNNLLFERKNKDWYEKNSVHLTVLRLIVGTPVTKKKV